MERTGNLEREIEDPIIAGGSRCGFLRPHLTSLYYFRTFLILSCGYLGRISYSIIELVGAMSCNGHILKTDMVSIPHPMF